MNYINYLDKLRDKIEWYRVNKAKITEVELAKRSGLATRLHDTVHVVDRHGNGMVLKVIAEGEYGYGGLLVAIKIKAWDVTAEMLPGYNLPSINFS